MVTYVIASKSTQPFLPECQMLGEFLEQNCPDVSVQVVIKSNDDWGEYIDCICRSYGFYIKSCPFIFTLEGEPIGDGANFVEHVRARYCRASIQMSKELQDTRATANKDMIEELLRNRKHGLTMSEKIEKHLEKIKKKELISHICDSFFEEIEEQGRFMFVRRTNLQREDGRTLNIDDEVEVEDAEMRARMQEEENKDLQYDTYREEFQGHIEGTIKNEREPHESVDEEQAAEAKKSVKSKTSKRSVLNKTASEFQGEESASKNMSHSRSRISVGGDGKSEMGKTNASFKFDLPESCFLTLIKRLLIDKLPGKYFVSSHPFPKIEGELLIIRPKKDDQTSKDAIIYRDYSLRKRIETNSMVPSSSQRRKEEKKEKEEEGKPKEIEAKLQCLEIDLENPLTREEWNNIIKVVEQTQGLGWFQILPVGQKSSMPYQFNILHVLPSQNIPVACLPLDRWVSNHLAQMRRRERSVPSRDSKYQADAESNKTPREAQETLALDSGLFMIPEFQFDHCFYELNQENLMHDPATQIGEIYARCSTFLHLNTRPNSGITVMVTPRWFFVGVLHQPYYTTKGGNPVYLDGFDFAGLFSLQQVEESWPATAGLENQTISATDAVVSSTKSVSVFDDSANVAVAPLD